MSTVHDSDDGDGLEAHVDIPGIPESIPRARVVELVEALGMDLRDLVSFEVQRHAIAAEVFARDEQGQRFINDGEHIATHRLAIPIVDQLDTADVGRSVVEAIRAYENRGKDDPGPEPQPA